MTFLKTSTTSKAVMAIAVAAVTLTAIVPAAFAAGPDRGGREFQVSRDGGPKHHRDGDRRGGPRGQFLALGCDPNAAERIETSLVRLGYHVEATGEQKALLDALKTSALDAQADLAAVCADVMPAPADATAEAPAADAAAPAEAAPAEAPDMLTRLQSGLKLQEARLAALTAVMPQFEAFYTSLNDEQKAKLEPRGGREGRDGRDGRDGRGHGRDRDRGDRN